MDSSRGIRGNASFLGNNIQGIRVDHRPEGVSEEKGGDQGGKEIGRFEWLLADLKTGFPHALGIVESLESTDSPVLALGHQRRAKIHASVAQIPA